MPDFLALIHVKSTPCGRHATETYRDAIAEELIEETLSTGGLGHDAIGVITEVTVHDDDGQPEGLPRGWHAQGPYFKRAEHYLSADSGNPAAASPGYGWPIGTTCWYWTLRHEGARLHATGATLDAAWARALVIATSLDPAAEEGATS